MEGFNYFANLKDTMVGNTSGFQDNLQNLKKTASHMQCVF